MNIPRLSSSGFEVLPLVGPSETIVRWLNDNGVDELVHTHDFPGAWAKPRGVARLTLPFLYLRCLRQAAARIAALVNARHIDAIFAAMPFSWVAATAVARKLGVPVIWRAGGTEISSFERMALAVWARFHPPDLLVCCGEAVHRLFAPLVPAPAVVVANGVDTQMFHPLAGDRQRFRPPGAKLVVGLAARLCAQKRPEDFLRMAAALGPLHREVSYLVAGEGSRRADYQAMANASPARDQIRFLGYVDDMRSFYAACDVVVLPSRSEGCPNVVLESMAMRRTLVVSNTAGTREVVGDGREGLVFPVGDIVALTAAVRRVIEQASLRQALETRAYERVQAKFSTEASARHLADLLRTVITEAAHDRARPAAAADKRPTANGSSTGSSNGCSTGSSTGSWIGARAALPADKAGSVPQPARLTRWRAWRQRPDVVGGGRP